MSTHFFQAILSIIFCIGDESHSMNNWHSLLNIITIKLKYAFLVDYIVLWDSMPNHEAANWPLCQSLKLPIGSFNNYKLTAFKDHLLGLKAANWQHRRIFNYLGCQLPAFVYHTV